VVQIRHRSLAAEKEHTMKSITKTLALAGTALALLGASLTVPAAANADTPTGLASSGISLSSIGSDDSVGTVDDGGDTIDGLNVCKTYYTWNYNTPGCNALPIAPLCRAKVKHVICTRY
jgi:hypothetical protein